MTPDMIEDSKKLISLMGMPVIQAPGEGESQCKLNVHKSLGALLCKEDIVYATASEDYDTLTFGSNYLLSGLNNKSPFVTQISLQEVLQNFGMTQNVFSSTILI